MSLGAFAWRAIINETKAANGNTFANRACTGQQIILIHHFLRVARAFNIITNYRWDRADGNCASRINLIRTELHLTRLYILASPPVPILLLIFVNPIP